MKYYTLNSLRQNYDISAGGCKSRAEVRPHLALSVIWTHGYQIFTLALASFSAQVCLIPKFLLFWISKNLIWTHLFKYLFSNIECILIRGDIETEPIDFSGHNLAHDKDIYCHMSISNFTCYLGQTTIPRCLVKPKSMCFCIYIFSDQGSI